MIELNNKINTKIWPNIAGFLVSLICTCGAYFLGLTKALDAPFLYEMIIAFGLLQVASQITFYFRFGKEKKPRWSLIMFLLMVLVIFFIIGGSIWIMNNLNYYNMSHVTH